ncbi:MAG: NGG1p interacting factor 3 protein, NIF3 [Peptococcaceae bacterium BICA1-8]|nr:MAG: NGG1p interacting factor 3 protein, NIF3 [Peptococcaceae bacterium BICA1-8]
MKLKEIYELVVNMGKEADPRGNRLEQVLKSKSKEFNDLKEEDKKYFDQDKLFNPYADTRILYGKEESVVKTVLAGIDVETAEILLADRLTEKGTKIDLVLSHHPEGKALAGLHEVMELQEEILYDLGVPINVAQGILASRISEVQRGLMPLNHNRGVDTAKILDIPLMCAHTPADNQVQYFLEKLFLDKDPEYLGDIIKLLKEIPEYEEAIYLGAGPKIIGGTEKRKTGKVIVDMTGGTSGSENTYEKLSAAGIGTIVGMHMGEKHRKAAEKNHINVIIAGHIASDSLGMNLILDKLEDKGLNIIPCSGIIRVKRR